MEGKRKCEKAIHRANKRKGQRSERRRSRWKEATSKNEEMTVREGCRKGSEEAYVRRGCEGLSEGETERGIRTYVLTLSRGQARERERFGEKERTRYKETEGEAKR